MALYVPKPVSAFQLGRHWPQDECNRWFHDAIDNRTIITHNMGSIYDPNKESYVELFTLMGWKTVRLGDYLLKDHTGQIFAMKEADFNEHYKEI